MARSRSMQTLTDNIKARYPGVVIYGIGDAAHQGSASGHNEDDTPGSRPEEEDADDDPEHRAIDVMVGPRFPIGEARKTRAKLTDRPANRRRLRYVILEQTIWRARNGWAPERYNGAFHKHIHASGLAADDDNGAEWFLGDEIEQPKGGDEDMRMIIGTLKGRATAWSGLRGLVPLHAHSHGQAVSALLAAGAVSQTFETAEALVEALGTYASGDVAGAVADVKRAG
jgi:hypothetical protein